MQTVVQNTCRDLVRRTRSRAILKKDMIVKNSLADMLKVERQD